MRSPELVTCRAIWQIMHEQMMWVIIPFSERIRFHAINNRRNPDMLYDLIKSHAALFYQAARAEDERGRDALRVCERGGFHRSK